MIQHNHRTAPTQFVEAKGIRFAYRRFGKTGAAPLVFNQHFRGTMDYWDPAVTDGLARNREVILFNNAGVSSSSGKVPTSFQEMGANAIAFIKALGLAKVDALGFSIGGTVAQEITAQALDLVRRLILIGTGPRGADMSMSKSAEIFAGAYDPPEHLWLAVHFSPSASSRAAGLAFLKRKLLRQDRDPEVSEEAAAAQREAIGKYIAPAENVFAYLKDMRQPTLIVQGSNDVIIPTVNSYILQQNLPNAQLIVYPDANHGSFYQHPELFVSDADQFLRSALQDGDAKLRPSERLPFPSVISGFNIRSREIQVMTALSGKTALVTGASRGIGRASALALAKAGAQVLVHYGSGVKEAEAVVAQIRKAGGRADAIAADLAAPDGPHRLAKRVRAIVGDRLDILVADAGISKAATIEETTVEDFDKLFAVNVRAPFFLVQQLLPILSKGSSIVFVSSLAARAAVGTIPAYGATKGAIDTMVKHFASLLGERQIRVNAVAPGVVATDMSNFTKTDAGREFALGMQAFKRLAQSDDIGGVVAFLASDDARWITGDTVYVDGGSKL